MVLLLAQARSANADYEAFALSPLGIALSLAILGFNIFCTVRCIQNEKWLMLILGWLCCAIFLWIGAFSSGPISGGQRRRRGKTVWHRY